MSQPVQVLSDCPACRVESAVLELVLPEQPVIGSCRLCGHAVEGGRVVRAGRVFNNGGEVVAALAAWAHGEGEEPRTFVTANFAAGTPEAVGALVLAGARVETSFDVVAWLFRSRTAGSMALGGGGEAGTPSVAAGEAGGPSWGGGASPPATPPAGRAADGGPRPPAAFTPDPRATTRALTATALADGRVEAAERKVLLDACARLGAPTPVDDDWRAWRPAEVGVPPDPTATVRAMVAVALADRIPDSGEARVIREFARAWRVPVGDPILPPVTLPQKAAAAWLGLFAR
jgi:hypothetical protein